MSNFHPNYGDLFSPISNKSITFFNHGYIECIKANLAIHVYSRSVKNNNIVDINKQPETIRKDYKKNIEFVNQLQISQANDSWISGLHLT